MPKNNKAGKKVEPTPLYLTYCEIESRINIREFDPGNGKV
ncbi:Uncharacterised protein [Legionella pneumophila]|nr:Uncharacterised protein [Legionella pneumophila]